MNKKEFNLRKNTERFNNIKNEIINIIESEYEKTKGIQKFGGLDCPRLSSVINHRHFITYNLRHLIHYMPRSGHSVKDRKNRMSYVEKSLIDKIDEILLSVEQEVGFKIDIDEIKPRQKYNSMPIQEQEEIDERNERIKEVLPALEKKLL